MAVTDGPDILRRHVVAMSCHRMHRRLQHETLSQPYFASLLKIKPFSFPEHDPEEKPKKRYIDSDIWFVSNVLPHLEGKLQTKIPNLMQLTHNNDRELYTKATCMEFHLLLCELLQRFAKAVASLNDTRPKTRTPASADFDKHLANVLRWGYCLYKLVRGAAIGKHLRAIMPQLDDHRRVETKPYPRGGIGEDEDDGGDDVELRRVQPNVVHQQKPYLGQRVPLWKSYQDWLRLMVVQFDAVEVVVGYARSDHFRRAHPKGEISIKVLVSPTTSREMLDWTKLFTSEHFPDPTDATAANMIDSPDQETNATILDYLVKYTSVKNLGAHLTAIDLILRQLKKFPDDIVKRKGAISFLFKQLDELKDSQFPGWEHSMAVPQFELLRKKNDECLERMRKTAKGSGELLGNRAEAAEASGLDGLISDLIKTFHVLKDKAKFFNDLKDLKTFTGSLHCEACLGSLIKLLKTISPGSPYADIASQLRVGVMTFL